MSVLDRIRVVLLVTWPKVIGRFWIDTEVVHSPVGEVRHTTRIHKWGITLFDSRELFRLDPKGRELAVSGEQRIWPTRWRTRGFGDSHGQIDETATRASYEFEWFGTRLRQTGEIVGEGVVLTMDTGWARGVQHLQRR